MGVCLSLSVFAFKKIRLCCSESHQPFSEYRKRLTRLSKALFCRDFTFKLAYITIDCFRNIFSPFLLLFM